MNQPNDLVSAALVAALKPIKRHDTRDWLGYLLDKIYFTDSECWLWYGAVDRGGYGTTKTPQKKAHRLSWELFNGPIPDGLKVCHKCDVPNCVNPDHLFLGTQADNIRDMCSKGRNKSGGACGERHGGHILTASKVLEMRQIKTKTTVSYERLGQMFGVSRSAAHAACVGNHWKKL